MNEPPSFYQLFRRSRYKAVEQDRQVPGLSGRNQREVFAVAALGFVLRHEPAFLAHFLAKTCELDHYPTDRAEIRCQDGHKSDLAIIWPDRRVLVVEAKIDAQLESKQNPTEPAFDAKPEGYGFQIRRDYPKESERYYLVLEKQERYSPKPRPNGHSPLFLGFRRWGELGGMADEPKLVIDLLDSLGALGIPELQLRRFLNMKLEDTTSATSKMFKLIEGLADQFGIDSGRYRWDIGDSSDSSHFGVNIRAKDCFAKLSIRLGTSDKDVIGWFGYESLHIGIRRAVWIYSEDRKSRGRVEEFASSKGLRVSPPDAEGYAILVSPEGDSDLDDVSWFRAVLGRLAD